MLEKNRRLLGKRKATSNGDLYPPPRALDYSLRYLSKSGYYILAPW